MSRTVIIGKFALGTYRYKPYYFICSGTHCVGSGLFWTGSGSDQTINDEPCTIWLQIQIRIQTRIRRIKINFLSNIHQKTKTNKYFLYSVGGFYNIVNMVAYTGLLPTKLSFLWEPLGDKKKFSFIFEQLMSFFMVKQ